MCFLNKLFPSLHKPLESEKEIIFEPEQSPVVILTAKEAKEKADVLAPQIAAQWAEWENNSFMSVMKQVGIYSKAGLYSLPLTHHVDDDMAKRILPKFIELGYTEGAGESTCAGVTTPTIHLCWHPKQAM